MSFRVVVMVVMVADKTLCHAGQVRSQSHVPVLCML